jgi:hypothetical protein
LNCRPNLKILPSVLLSVVMWSFSLNSLYKAIFYFLKLLEVCWRMVMIMLLSILKRLKDWMIWLSNVSVLTVPDEGYSRNVSCTLNLISTFLLHTGMFIFFYSSWLWYGMLRFQVPVISEIRNLQKNILLWSKMVNGLYNI